MRRRVFIPFFLVVALFARPASIHAMGTPPPHKHIPLRVLVVKAAEKIDLRIKGPYRIVDFETEGLLEEDTGLRGRVVSESDIASEGIKILSENKTRIYINNRLFRGNIDIIKNKDAKLMVVNHIDLEEYLYGVLYHEVSHRWPMEVLKAQAIAARTYALYQKLVSKNRYYDLFADIYSQVYGGRQSETLSTRRAVNSTLGMVLAYDDMVFPAYYHATCGGRTSDASTIWDINTPCLRGVECGFCKMSPHYQWKKEMTVDEIREKLRDAGYKIDIISIEVLDRDTAERALNVLVKGKSGTVELKGNKFRLLLGPNNLKSANFEIEKKGKYVKFYGKGWGHGIGMCQWGAFGMARHGWKAEEILGHYYQGAEIVRVEE
ncbi:MAG: SpoIID/LytB domain-containing protein [Candidatus Omnitrophica bacterium]|nr:SpoIID/LytB domain-containing protein [Candidatus Omnitrophota bacterium]